MNASERLVKLECILSEIGDEVTRAVNLYPKFNSAHEGYAVLLEEVDELWDEVKKSPKRRDYDAMRTEAMQVAAMAVRLMMDCIE
jgi:cation transport regulator ChaB